MKYAGIIKNDVLAAPGISVSFFTQGCPHHCKGCHNPETWSFDGGREFTSEVLSSLIKDLTANGVERNLAIMGGEPLCPENLFLVNLIIHSVKEALPKTKIYVWTGYLYEELRKDTNKTLQDILSNIDVLIDGPFIEEQRDITLFMRGSKNQRILYLNEK